MDRTEVMAKGPREPRHSARRFIRGSSLLLVGRLISVGVNFLVQVLAVRYLAKSDFGALSWALSIAGMGSSIVLLGLNRSVARFVTIYHERREYGAMFGTIGMALGTATGLGLAAVVLVLGIQGLLASHVESLSVGLLVILIGLTPLDALDALFEALIAIFAGARLIFFRRYVLAPGLKLVAVLLVMWVGGSVRMLAVAYLAAGMIGIALYAVLLWELFARQGLLAQLHPRRMIVPARALMSYSLPVWTTDLLLAVETPLVVVILERYRSTLEVAELRAVAPVAGLCLLIFQNSKILFKPHASRLFARGDEAGLGELYWRSAAWIAIATFPVFAVCVFLAEPLTLLLFGPHYAGAGVLLALLAVGKYVNAAMGMNTFTLQVYARVWIVLLVNVFTALMGLGLCLWLVPRFGAVGGAAATSAAIVIRNFMYQAGLIATTRAGITPRPALKVYGWLVAAVAVLSAVRMVSGSVAVMAPAVVLVAPLLLWLNRGYLDVVDTFPELARLPWLRRFLDAQPG